MTNDIERRHINLTQGERAELTESRQIEEAVSYFLDLEQDWTNKQIAENMGMSLSALKRLTQKPEFMAKYDEVLMGLGHHPRLHALNASLPELAAPAYMALKQILTNPRASATARVAAAKLVFDTLHLSDQRPEEDPAAINNFLKNAGVNVQANVVNVNLPIPEEYREAFIRLIGSDTNIVEGVVSTPDNQGDSGDGGHDTSSRLPGGQPSSLPAGEEGSVPAA
jgi:hypothetical protein